ncbi:(2Fe-2S)-binding protein [Actinokineospora fastidiosa]|uniref:Fe-S oxidoreductase n=1 Tax=Actinokineospora fastidiosa TaxID=1816 RepID=A0A918LHF7_9PSEU|nr:(2Fe-2S)-binding protein [Actinokineospora fastidiosa]GGS51458.1 Fe-S oxidoreductase [Actinokineospora fastidiosa]
MSDVAAVGDPEWVAGRIGSSRSRYPGADARVLGTLWWYEASSALVGPVVESAVAGGPVADACSMVLSVTPDGRVADARARAVRADPGPALREVLAAGITAVSSVSGASARSLWAIATDSVGNRTLWAGGTPAHAVAVAAAVGPDLPVPRFAVAGGRLVVRRASCCLIYRAGEPKCVSCPRQTPEVRARRLEG